MYIIGVDEVGRGPLAGPVAVGVALVPGNFDWEQTLPGVTDSKQLTEKRREEIFELTRRLKNNGDLDFAVAMVSAKVIDQIGIVPAVRLALQRALGRVGAPPNAVIKLDGGLRAPEMFQNQETIIKGDAKESVIGLASICAKVTRDRYMIRKSSDQDFVPYNFGVHKGYGTKAHRAAIQQHGLSTMHRNSYCKNLN